MTFNRSKAYFISDLHLGASYFSNPRQAEQRVVAFLDSIPGCVMGGVCITLYGFIAVSGLKMIQKVDLEDHSNLFTVSVILIPGIGGMAMAIGGTVFITPIACALVLGIVTNFLLTKFKKEKNDD